MPDTSTIKRHWAVCALALVLLLLPASPMRADDLDALRSQMYRYLESKDFTRGTGQFDADISNDDVWNSFEHQKGKFKLLYAHPRIPQDYLALHIRYPQEQRPPNTNQALPDCGTADLRTNPGQVISYQTDPGSSGATVRTPPTVQLKCWLPFSDRLGWSVSVNCPSYATPLIGSSDMRQVCAPLIRDMQAIVNERLGTGGGTLPTDDDMPFDPQVLIAIAAALGALGIGWPVVKFLLRQFLSRRPATAAPSPRPQPDPQPPAGPYEGYEDDANYLRFRKKDLEKLKNDLASYRRHFKSGDPGFSKQKIAQMQADIRLAEKDLKAGIKSMTDRGATPPDLRDIGHDSDVYADTGGVREGVRDSDALFNNRDHIRNFLHRNPEYEHLHDRILKPDGSIDQDLLNKVKRLHTQRMESPLPRLGVLDDADTPLALYSETLAGSFKDMSTSNGLAATTARCVLDGITGGYSELVFTPAGEYYNAQDYFAKNQHLLGTSDDPGLSDQLNLWTHAMGNATYNVLLGEGMSRAAGHIVKAGAKGIGAVGGKVSAMFDEHLVKYADDITRNDALSNWAKGQKTNPWKTTLSGKTLDFVQANADARILETSNRMAAMKTQMDAVRDFGAFINDNLINFNAENYASAQRMFAGNSADLVITKDLGKTFNTVFGKTIHEANFPTTDSIVGNVVGQHAGNIVKYINNLWNE